MTEVTLSDTGTFVLRVFKLFPTFPNIPKHAWHLKQSTDKFKQEQLEIFCIDTKYSEQSVARNCHWHKKLPTHKSMRHTKYKVFPTQNTKRVAQNINSFQSVLHLSHQLTLEEGETMDSQLQTKNDIGLYIDLLLQWSYWLREQVKSHIWVRQLFYLPNIGSQSSHQSSLINISAFQILVYVRLFWPISSFLLSFLVCWPLYWPISSGIHWVDYLINIKGSIGKP